MQIAELRDATKAGRWPSLAHVLLASPRPQECFVEAFSTYWIESGHRIRAQVNDDRLLVRLLRHLLPPYQGSAMTLFRGENIERLKAGNIGLAWSSNADVAIIFGRGLNSTPSGGTLLTAHFQPQAIICGPNTHSQYLGEDQFTIDPFCGATVTPIETFPPLPSDHPL